MDYKNYNPRAAALAQARTLLTDAVKAAIADGTLPEAALPDFIVEIPADVKNGDIASNVAMAGARAFHKAPRQIAEAITAKLQLDGSLFDRFEVAGPGFINLFLGQDWFTSVVRAAVANPEYGRTDVGAGKKVQRGVCFCQPHRPHAYGQRPRRCAGDGLAACLDWAGYDVTREFYINDAGNQIEKVRQESGHPLSAAVQGRGRLPAAGGVLSGRGHHCPRQGVCRRARRRLCREAILTS